MKGEKESKKKEERREDPRLGTRRLMNDSLEPIQYIGRDQVKEEALYYHRLNIKLGIIIYSCTNTPGVVGRT